MSACLFYFFRGAGDGSQGSVCAEQVLTPVPACLFKGFLRSSKECSPRAVPGHQKELQGRDSERDSVEEHLPSMGEALCSTPTLKKKKSKNHVIHGTPFSIR